MIVSGSAGAWQTMVERTLQAPAVAPVGMAASPSGQQILSDIDKYGPILSFNRLAKGVWNRCTHSCPSSLTGLWSRSSPAAATTPSSSPASWPMPAYVPKDFAKSITYASC